MIQNPFKFHSLYSFCCSCSCLLVFVPYCLILWNIVETSIAIDSFPSNWTELKNDETCPGEYHLRIFVVGALACSCVALPTLNISSCFTVVWPIIGAIWMTSAHVCKSTDPLLWNTALHSEIVLWVNFLICLISFILICINLISVFLDDFE